MDKSYRLHTENPTLIFDVGGVLLKHDASGLKNACISHCVDQPRALGIWSETIESGRLSTGAVSVRQFHKNLVASCGLQLPWAEFVTVWNHFFEDEPGALHTAHRLEPYRLVVLSNTNEEHWAHMLTMFPVLSCFDHAYLSYRLRMAKPDSRIYSAILASEGIRAIDCIFFDDSPANVRAARNSGWAAHVCNGIQEVTSCLEEYGILS